MAGKNMKKFVLILMVMSVSGCAVMEWVHPTKSKEEFYTEKLTCEELANRLAWQRFPQPTGITVQNTVYSDSTHDESNQAKSAKSSDPYYYDRSSYREGRLKECLQSKGWVQQEVKKTSKK
jgi:hypothetical protein